jgi:aspartate carbamoyltransferase regulatory subunit
MNIDTIKNGYVIDHIKAGQAMEIYDYLRLGDLDCSVAIIKNARSQKMGRKDIIKIDQNIPIDIDVLGYLDPNITINVIRNNEKVRKFKPDLPEKLVNVISCKNPRCITSIEQELPHICILTDPERRTYRCQYCESKVN